MTQTLRLTAPTLWRTRLALAGASLLIAVAALLPSLGHSQTVQLPDFTELVERVGPSVVNIRTTERRAGAAAGGPQQGMDPNM
jgi:serine protease Do